MYSLKKKLHRNLLVTVTFIMLALISVFYQGINSLTQEYVSSRLKHDADSIIAALTEQPNGQWKLPTERTSTVYDRVQSGHYYIVVVNNQIIRSRSLFDKEIELPDVDVIGNSCLSMKASGSEQWLYCISKVTKKGNEFVIWVAEDITSVEYSQNQFMLFALSAVVLSIVVLLMMQYHILQRAFGQLDKIREAIKQMHLGENNLESNLLPIEIMPLIEEIDRLLVQLSSRVQRSRNSLGNLAHELKRPLQRYRILLDTLNPKQQKDGSSILQDIHSVVERELKRARIVGVSTPGRHLVVDDDLPHLVQVMQSIYPDKTITMNFSKGLILPQDRDDILELLGNLLDNACKYANRNVFISLEQDDLDSIICIEDDGDGITEDALKTITDRGVRLDESIHGHGLGLSICKDVIESYSGSIAFESSISGGLAVTARLPKGDFNK